jgi:Putative peptidoglycan binding domain/Lytic transglycolase
MNPRGARKPREDDYEQPLPRAELRLVEDAPSEPRRHEGSWDWSDDADGDSGPVADDFASDLSSLRARADRETGAEAPRKARRIAREAPAPEAPAVPVAEKRPPVLEEPPPVSEAPAPRFAREEPPSEERRTIVITGRPTPARRRSPASAQIAAKPDRIALWAVMLGLFLVFMAAATARGAEWSHATLGERVLSKGDRGSDVVTLQRVLDMKGYSLSADGVFGPQTKGVVKRFQARRRLARDGVVGPMTTAALARTWRQRTATYYGPGLYGNRTACGHTLAHRTRGVAHRSLSCGTRVAVYRAGRIVVLPVIDRGPFTDGVTFDITEAAARKLGMSSTSRIRAGY